MALTRDQICTLVLSRLGRREGDTYLLAQAKLELQLIQSRLESGAFLPWFLLSGDVTIATTVANTRTVDLPSDFIREWEDSKLTIYDATAATPYTKLNKDEYDYLLEQYGEAAAGTPDQYALVGSQYVLFATPNAAFTLKQNYFKTQSVLSDSVATNVWTVNAGDLLIAELGIVMARYAKNPDAERQFGVDQGIAMQRLRSQDIARGQANRDAQRGDIH